MFRLIYRYSRFQVTFQSAFPKFVLDIPNYIHYQIWNIA